MNSSGVRRAPMWERMELLASYFAKCAAGDKEMLARVEMLRAEAALAKALVQHRNQLKARLEEIFVITRDGQSGQLKRILRVMKKYEETRDGRSS